MENLKSIGEQIHKMFLLIGRKPDAEMIGLWASYLVKRGITEQQVKWLCSRAVEDPNLNQYSFSVASFLAYGENTDHRAIAEKRWDELLTHICRRGSNVPFDCDQRTEMAMRAAGGLSAIGMCDEQFIPQKRKIFIDTFVRKSEYDRIESNVALFEAISSDKLAENRNRVGELVQRIVTKNEKV